MIRLSGLTGEVRILVLRIYNTSKDAFYSEFLFQFPFPDCGLPANDSSSEQLQQQPETQQPLARSVETLTNHIVFSIIGAVTRRNSAEQLLSGRNTPDESGINNQNQNPISATTNNSAENSKWVNKTNSNI